MDLESEITNYLEANPGKTPTETVAFLVKLWNSGSLKSATKYETILKYFTKHSLPKIDEVEAAEMQRFFKLRHQPNCVSSESKSELIKVLSKSVKKSSSLEKIATCLAVVSNDGFKDFFKAHLDTYCKFLETILKSFIANAENENGATETFANIVTELYCFVKIDKFKDFFVEHVLISLSEATKNVPSTEKSAVLDLLKSIFFARITSSDSNLEIFESDLTQEKEFILMDTFIAINKYNPTEIAKFLRFINDNQLESCEDDDDQFLSQTKRIFLLLKTHEVDLAPVKRQEPGLFEKIAERVTAAVESSKHSMNFAEFLQTLSSFISCDAFLFEKNIYEILTDCMLKEKSAAELTNYEALLSIVIKIYGKDLNQFLKKLLKTIDVKLESLTLPKKRKRKLLSGSESEATPKKLKLASGEVAVDRCGDWTYIAHIWPSATAEQFAEIVAGLNVVQTIKVLTQLNDFLVKSLKVLKESSSISENVLFKIDFASNLLCELFANTRIHEQLMYKQEPIAKAANDFNQTQHLFYEIILNIEYNNRVMNAFLKLSSNYENFLMLYFYQHNADVKSSLELQFIGNQSSIRSEFEIIQQRIKNFGKAEEKNQLNSLMIQHKQKSQLFSVLEMSKSDDLSSILNDEKQVDFLLQKPDTRSFFINSLGSKELKQFAQYLIKLEDKELQTSALSVISQSQVLLDGFIADLLQNVDSNNFKVLLEIFDQLLLACASDDNKKLVFEKLLKHKITDNAQVVSVIEKLFKNDSYKMFFKDFTAQSVVQVFDGKCTKVHQSILSNAARKMNVNTLENFNWIVKNGDAELLEILAQVASEVPLTPASGVTAEAISKFKSDLIQKLLKNFNKTEVNEEKSTGFVALAKMCSENSSILKDDAKSQYMVLLQKFTKKIIKSPTAERVKLLLMTLKDAKKLNLNDEMKGNIVDTLLVYLKTTLLERMSSEDDDYLNVEVERQMFAALRPFKSNFQEGCVDILRKVLTEKTSISSRQLQYSFKIYQIAFETKSDDNKSSGFVKNYIKFHDEFAVKVLAIDDADKINAMVQIVDTNNALLRENKFQLDNTVIDEILCLLSDPRMKPPGSDAEVFCKFYTAVGETLFVVANVRQNYFKSRISQFFSVYRAFMEAVYFFRNDDAGELAPMEVSLLLKLTLQLENIMKMINKTHTASIKIISLYIASSIVNIFVKNPKTLSIGYKFKVNIKNICHELLSTFDDKTRKHVYSVADETTREIYDGLFNDIRRRS